MKLTFDYYNNLERVDLFLCNPDGRGLFPLPGRERVVTLRFNDLSELTFEVDSQTTLSNGDVVDLEAYDYIQTKRLVYATNIGWFQISGVDEHDNGIVKYKSVAAESLQAVFKNKGFISEERVYCFYNPNDPYDDRYDYSKDDSIPSVLGQWSKQLGIKQALHQGTNEPEAPYDDWTVTYINDSLIYSGVGSKCRTFSEKTTYGYDWMVNDVEDAFEVIVLFDFMYKTIHIVTPDEVSQKVNVLYTFNNFMKSVDINEISEDIVTVLNCNGNNCDITSVNPTGTNYICDFSYYMDKVNYRWMSPDLIDKLEKWKAACDAEKNTYEGHIAALRTLHQNVTKQKTLLKETSVSLADLRTTQNKRSVLGGGKDGELCGIISVESVKSPRVIVDGKTTAVEGYSAYGESKYFRDYQFFGKYDANNKKWVPISEDESATGSISGTGFTGSETVTAYEFAPKYNKSTRKWEFTDDCGASMVGTADEIVAHNLSDDNLTGKSYWYFFDVSDGSSYCKLQSAVTVNKDSTTSEYYCGGFDRYIAYTYPVAADNDAGTLIYTDRVSEWIALRESIVDTINVNLYGYTRQLNGYQFDDEGDVINPTADSLYGRVNDKNDDIAKISNRLNILSYFADTPALLRELNCYWIEGDYANENIAVLDSTTPEEEIDLSNELLRAGYAELNKVCRPRFSFSIDSIDVTKQYEFEEQMQLLELGKKITIEKEEGVWYEPVLLEISFKLDSSDDFSLTFANAMRLNDWSYTYADLIADASSTSRQVSANWHDILSYAKDRESISSIIQDPLNTTLRAGSANMVNQEFLINENGILGRKKVATDSTEFEDEQVRLINNLLIFTDDNWQTAKTALGKIYYTDENNNTTTSYGLIAETIIGSLIMGEKLMIKNEDSSIVLGAEGIIVKQNNETVFSANIDGDVFVKGEIEATSGSIGNLTINGKLTFGDDESYYIDVIKDNQGYYINLPGLQIDSSGAVFNGKIEAGTVLGSQLSIDGGSIELALDEEGDSLLIRDSMKRNYFSIGTNGISMSGFYLEKNSTNFVNLGSISMSSSTVSLSGYGIVITAGNNGGLMSGTWYLNDSSSPIKSDINSKNSVCDLQYAYDVFYDNLRPVTYKYNNGTSGRTHTGFIAQETKNALDVAGIDTKNFAGVVIKDNQDGTQSWFLRYQEFISLNTWQIQKLKARVAELEAVVKKLQEK